MKFNKGQKVKITMKDHVYFGQIGTVVQVLHSFAIIPDAIQIVVDNGYRDWFFGINNLEKLFVSFSKPFHRLNFYKNRSTNSRVQREN